MQFTDFGNGQKSRGFLANNSYELRCKTISFLPLISMYFIVKKNYNFLTTLSLIQLHLRLYFYEIFKNN